MTDTNLVDEVLKTNRLGRVKTPKERREAMLDEYERGGMSGKAFAEHYGVKYQTFASWVQKRRRQRAAGGESEAGSRRSLRLVEAVIERGKVAAAAPGMVVRVELPGGASVEVGDAGQAVLVGRLLRAYSEPVRPC